ncbi:outer membrane protein assembly factor BamB family protein [Jatrophihabitans sp. YIM 134969]
MPRRLVLLVVAVLALGVVTATPALAAPPTITSVTPTSGPVGTLVTVVGTGFTARSTVTVGGRPATSVDVVTGKRIRARVPAGGVGVVAVTTGDGTAKGPKFTLTAGVTASPAVVRPTAEVVVAGTTFGAIEAVDVYLDTTAVALVVTDSAGWFTTHVATTRATTPGKHWVTAVGRRTGAAAQVAFTVRTDWPGPSFDAGHTGLNPFERALTPDTVDDLVERWTTPLDQAVYGPPAVAGGLVVFHTFLEDVVALDAATGAQVWRVTLADTNPGTNAPVVANGVVYVGSSDRHLHALSLATGARKWSYDTGGAIRDSPVVAGGKVYVASRTNGVLHALDAATGAMRWTTSFGPGFYPYGPTVVGGRIYLGATDAVVRALDAATGAVVWASAVPGQAQPYPPPVVADGRVFVTTVSGTVLSLRATTGALLWEQVVGSGQVTGTPALVGDRLVVADNDPVVTALDVLSGAPLWTHTGDEAGTSPVSAAGGVAYVSSSGRTVAYDVPSGAVVRRFGSGTGSAGVVVADGALYGFDAVDRRMVRWDLGARGAAAPSPASLSPGSLSPGNLSPGV